MAVAFAKLKPDVVLVTGDRVEAFAAATAGHLSGRIVAHAHGGDRALGLVDDSLRHAITKLSHVHFPATKLSRRAHRALGEDPWRIFAQVRRDWMICEKSSGMRAMRSGGRIPGFRRPICALLFCIRKSTDAASQERDAAGSNVHCADAFGWFERIVIVYPNNDPGSDGIASCWDALKHDERHIVRRDIPRPLFLGLLRDAAVLAGNSSSGIIEAASFGTPVLDIGHRQMGRERGENVRMPR